MSECAQLFVHLLGFTNCQLLSAQLTGDIPGNIHLAGVSETHIYCTNGVPQVCQFAQIRI